MTGLPACLLLYGVTGRVGKRRDNDDTPYPLVIVRAFVRTAHRDPSLSPANTLTDIAVNSGLSVMAARILSNVTAIEARFHQPVPASLWAPQLPPSLSQDQEGIWVAPADPVAIVGAVFVANNAVFDAVARSNLVNHDFPMFLPRYCSASIRS